jgi:hypothetical protein
MGEVFGALAVVLTILYISKEIRQNSKALEVNALRDTTAQWNHWSNMLASSPDLADIVTRGNHSFAELSDSESLRYGAYIQSFFDNAESYRTLVVEIKLEKDIAVLESIVARRLAIPGFLSWWAENRSDYAAEFADWIDSLRN